MSFSVSADSKTYRIPESCCKNKGTATCRNGIVTKLGAEISSEIYPNVSFCF